MSVRCSIVVGLLVCILVGFVVGSVRLLGRRAGVESKQTVRSPVVPELTLAVAAVSPKSDRALSLPELIRETNREVVQGFEGAILDLLAWRIYLNQPWQQASDFGRLCPALHAAQVSLWQEDLLLEEGLVVPQLVSTDGLPKEGERHQLHVVEFPTLSAAEFSAATTVLIYFETDRKWSYTFRLEPVADRKRSLVTQGEGWNPLRTFFRDPRQVTTAKLALREVFDEETKLKERPRTVRRRRPYPAVAALRATEGNERKISPTLPPAPPSE